MEELPVLAGADLVNGLIRRQSIPTQKSKLFAAAHRGVEVDEDGAGDVFAAASLGEESLKGASLSVGLAFGVGATIGLETVLQEVAGRAASVFGMLEVGNRMLTAPRRCYRAGYQLDRCGCGKPTRRDVSAKRCRSGEEDGRATKRSVKRACAGRRGSRIGRRTSPLMIAVLWVSCGDGYVGEEACSVDGVGVGVGVDNRIAGPSK